MNKRVRKYIVLTIAILIPLLAAFLVSSYGYNSEKFGKENGAWVTEFNVEYFTPEKDATTRDRIENNMHFSTSGHYYSYDPTPALEMEIKNDDGEKLMDVLAYKTLYLVLEEDKYQYIFFFYNIQYQNIRDMFAVDEHVKDEINNSLVPKISARLGIIDDENPRSLLISLRDEGGGYISSIPDTGADFKTNTGKMENEIEEFETGDTILYVYEGVTSLPDVYSSNTFTINLEATVDVLEGEAGKVTIISPEFQLDTNPENQDHSEFLNSLEGNATLSPNYFNWVVKNYLWWIFLLTFLGVGLVTGSFFVVYTLEEKRIEKEGKKQKRKRK